MSFDDITDGISVTLMFAEIGTADDRRVRGQYAIDQPASYLDNVTAYASIVGKKGQSYQETIPLSADGRGGRWADGSAGYTLFNAILPPNSASFAVGGEDLRDGYYSASSYHPDGINVAFMDGSVRFIADTVDIGLPNRQPITQDQLKVMAETGNQIPSPHGVWGSMAAAKDGQGIEE